MSALNSAARRLLAAVVVAVVVAESVAALAAPAASASPFLGGYGVRASTPGSVVLGGLSQQDWPVVLSVSPNRKRIGAAVIGLKMTCASGAVFGVHDGFIGLPVGRNGKVHAASTFPTVTDPSGSMSGSDAMGGTLHPRQLTFNGWWRLQLDYKSPSGQTDHCDSGRVSFSARL